MDIKKLKIETLINIIMIMIRKKKKIKRDILK